MASPSAAAASPSSRAALCILTQNPSSALNERMRKSFELAPGDESGARAVGIRWCVFEDEWRRHSSSSSTTTTSSTTLVLQRPDGVVARRQEYECVSKIIAWLRYAHDHLPSSDFVGWIDSDTWLLPRRLAVFLEGVAAVQPPRSVPVWIGAFMHWSRFDEQLLDGFGFQLDSDLLQERKALTLRNDKPANRAYLGLHQKALGLNVSNPNAAALARARSLGFAMAQGSFILYSRAALATLVRFVERSDVAHRFLGVSAPSVPPLPPLLRRPKPNSCLLPTDVGLGWLTTQAYSSQGNQAAVDHDPPRRRTSALHVINLFQVFELFVWPSSRFSKNHTLVVHLADAKNGNFGNVLDSIDERTGGGSAALVPPRLHCKPVRWLHTATRNWTQCLNLAPCESLKHPRPPPPPPPTNLSLKPGPPSFEGWLPAPVRGSCFLAGLGPGA